MIEHCPYAKVPGFYSLPDLCCLTYCLCLGCFRGWLRARKHLFCCCGRTKEQRLLPGRISNLIRMTHVGGARESSNHRDAIMQTEKESRRGGLSIDPLCFCRSEKRDELASVAGIDQRNQKIIASIKVYRCFLSVFCLFRVIIWSEIIIKCLEIIFRHAWRRVSRRKYRKSARYASFR